VGLCSTLQTLCDEKSRSPLTAVDKNGNDVLSYVQELDNTPAPIDMAGLDEYTFDFGPIADRSHVKLLPRCLGCLQDTTPLDVQPFVEAQDGAGIGRGCAALDDCWRFEDRCRRSFKLAPLIQGRNSAWHLGVWPRVGCCWTAFVLMSLPQLTLQSSYLEASFAELCTVVAQRPPIRRLPQRIAAVMTKTRTTHSNILTERHKVRGMSCRYFCGPTRVCRHATR